MLLNTKKKSEFIPDFNTVSLRLASPERILDWSYGEVTKPETINYRTGRAERGGLFDERIFGPEKDYECYCGKYKRIRYKGIVCEKCGVEVTRSIVRRERMGHIELASPVAHIWFVRNIPSRLGLLLDLSIGDLEKVIYFAGYIVTKVNEDEKRRVLREMDGEFKSKMKSADSDTEKEKLKNSLLEAKRQVESLLPWKVIDEVAFNRLALKYGTVFEAQTGAEALHQICQGIKLEELLATLGAELEKAGSLEKPKLQKRFNLVKKLMRAGVRPEWMFLKNIPVIPPALRPMVALDGGRHATSDVNDLYRRVINRNNRLRKLVELRAPEVILRNEKRILQEAVDSLLDNSIRRGGGDGAMNQTQRRLLKSLADGLKGKQGRFRQNLLGKRVDYSGRSVIVVGPDLKFDQCGLPKHMALELFRPFVVAKILERELAFNIRGANRLIDEATPEVWAILEEVIQDKYVLLNRAPTLHRLGIQAFRPILVEGNAIQIHPLVCDAYNADFDGDQMAVHLPLSDMAQMEAREIMASNRNILKPGSGDPVINLKRDIVLGCFWVTKIVPGAKGEGKIFAGPNSAIMAYDFGDVDLRAKIKVMGGKSSKYGELSGQVFETTVGRILFNNSLPVNFLFVNEDITAKKITKIFDEFIQLYGLGHASHLADNLKAFGFRYATVSGTTWGMDDVQVPEDKKEIVEVADKETEMIEDKYAEGLLSEEERSEMIIEVWKDARNKLEKVLPDRLIKDGPVYDLIKSNARGSIGQLAQMAGMKGLIVNPGGRLIDFPVVPSYKEGLSPLEYFITTHGSRKGLADTALNTAKAGYLTRRLVDVAQDVVITEEDCGDKEGKLVTLGYVSGFDTGIASSIRGRVLAQEVKINGKVAFERGHVLTKEDAETIEQAGINEVSVRSPLRCKLTHGLCQKCYGEDPGHGGLIETGEAVGVIAAQAIGEPGTQLTMRTKHAGGAASDSGDIVGGLPRVEEIFERRSPKNQATICTVDGEISEITRDDKEYTIKVLPNIENKKKGKGDSEVSFKVSLYRSILFKKGDQVKKGQLLTDGSADLTELYKQAGRDETENYIIREVNQIYALQAVAIARKHIEIIIRQMFSRRKIKNAGDTTFAIDEVVDLVELQNENNRVKEEGGQTATTQEVLMGIAEVALTTSSFLSASSFMHTNKVLVDTAVSGGLDTLRGLKENVIIGRLIPAGTGLKARETGAEDEELRADEEDILVA